MFILGLILPISYVPAVTDLYILSGWIVLSLALPWFFFRPMQLGVSHYLGMGFLAYATLSLAWAPVFDQGIWDLWQLLILAACFCLGASNDNLRPLYLGLAWGIAINSALAIGQKFGWQPVHHNNSDYPAGLFFNPDMLGESAALVAIALYTVRAYWQIALTLPSIFLSGGRAALLAVIVAVVVEGWRKSRAITIAVCIALVGVAYMDNHKTASFEERKAIWLDTAQGLTWAGNGPGSFFMLYPKFADRTDTMLTRPEDPHNDYLGFAFQYGLGALLLVPILIAALCRSGPTTPLLWAYLAISFFSFPMRIPTEGLMGMVALGQLCRRSPLDGWVGAYWRSARNRWATYIGRPSVPLEPLHSHEAGV